MKLSEEKVVKRKDQSQRATTCNDDIRKETLTDSTEKAQSSEREEKNQHNQGPATKKPKLSIPDEKLIIIFF